MEVRINRKSGRIDVPNFGFVVFQEPGSVGKALASRVSGYYCVSILMLLHGLYI